MLGPLQRINSMKRMFNPSLSRSAPRRGHPCGPLDCRGLSGLAMTKALFGFNLLTCSNNQIFLKTNSNFVSLLEILLTARRNPARATRMF
jgi:hypothetical protein